MSRFENQMKSVISLIGTILTIAQINEMFAIFWKLKPDIAYTKIKYHMIGLKKWNFN